MPCFEVGRGEDGQHGLLQSGSQVHRSAVIAYKQLRPMQDRFELLQVFPLKHRKIEPSGGKNFSRRFCFTRSDRKNHLPVFLPLDFLNEPGKTLLGPLFGT